MELGQERNNYMIKLPMRKIGLVVLVFLVGCFTGLFGASYQYYKHVFSKAVAQNAEDVSWQIRTVSHLRLGEIDDAINSLEGKIDNNILAIARTHNITETDYRYRILREAKTYREIYPSNSVEASQVISALEKFPKLEKFKCENSLCRLVKQAQSQKK